MSARLAQLELHLPGLLKLLGEHLYSDRRVAFRELVQNAHDSCVRRRLEVGSGLPPCVDVRLGQEGGRPWVRFHDTGLGLNDDEIERFLATIGRGQTGALKERLAGSEDASELVGQFGVGLLSAFLIGDRVVVTTRRAGEEEGWRWICDGQQTYRLEPAEVPWEGTEVAVRFREDAEELARPSVVRDAIAHYARWLETPLYVEGERVNATRLPWTRPEGEGAPAVTEVALAAELCEGRPPIATLRLEDVDDPVLGRVPLEGLLCIPEGSQLSVREHGAARVLIRHMLVDPRDEGLLPRWARFVTGLVDCPLLEPTASRESVRREARFRAVRDGVERQLLAWLERLEREQPATWGEVVRAHESLLKRWALDAPALFEAVADRVTFRTSRGERTLPAYLEASGGTIYLYASEEQARTMELLLESARRPVIDAQYFADAPFLRLYAKERGVPLVEEAGQPGAGLLDPVPVEGAMAALVGELADAETEAVAARFAPVDVPAVLVTPRRLRLAEQAKEEARENAPLAGLLGDYAARAPVMKRTLHVNVDNPLVRSLAAEPAGAGRRAAATVLKELARLLGSERLAPEALLESARATGAALGALLGAEAARPAERPLHASWLEGEAGLSASVARQVAARCGSFERLAAEEPGELAAAVGLPRAMAEALVRLAGEG